MRSLSVHLRPSKKGRPIELYPFSCSHLGHVCHARDAMLSFFKYILSDPDRYMWVLADTMDNATKMSPGGSVFDQILNPYEQVIVMGNLVRPLVQKKRIVVWHNSNHGFRTYKDTGMWGPEEALHGLLTNNGVTKGDWNAMERYLATGLDSGQDLKASGPIKSARQYLAGLAERTREEPDPSIHWGEWQAITRVHAGKQKYDVYSSHGEGGGTSLVAALNALVKRSNYVLADLYFLGHFHISESMVGTRYMHGGAEVSGEAVPREYGLLTSASWLNYHKSYADAKGYIPKAIGCPCAVVQTGDHWGFELRSKSGWNG